MSRSLFTLTHTLLIIIVCLSRVLDTPYLTKVQPLPSADNTEAARSRTAEVVNTFIALGLPNLSVSRRYLKAAGSPSVVVSQCQPASSVNVGALWNRECATKRNDVAVL